MLLSDPLIRIFDPSPHVQLSNCRILDMSEQYLYSDEANHTICKTCDDICLTSGQAHSSHGYVAQLVASSRIPIPEMMALLVSIRCIPDRSYLNYEHLNSSKN